MLQIVLSSAKIKKILFSFHVFLFSVPIFIFTLLFSK